MDAGAGTNAAASCLSMPTHDPIDTVRLRVWRGCCPIILKGPSDQILLKLDVPRLSHFPLAFVKARQVLALPDDAHIDAAIKHSDGSFEALPMQLPVGLLYDLYHTTPGTPWHVYIATERMTLSLPNAGSWPPPPRLNIQTTDKLAPLLWQSFKQALLIRFGTLRAMQLLTPSQSAAMQEALVMLDFNVYFDLGERLWAKSSLAIPVRLCMSPAVFLQLAAPVRTEGRATTVQDCIALRIPQLVPLLLDDTVDGQPKSGVQFDELT